MSVVGRSRPSLSDALIYNDATVQREFSYSDRLEYLSVADTYS